MNLPFDNEYFTQMREGKVYGFDTLTVRLRTSKTRKDNIEIAGEVWSRLATNGKAYTKKGSFFNNPVTPVNNP